MQNKLRTVRTGVALFAACFACAATAGSAAPTTVAPKLRPFIPRSVTMANLAPLAKLVVPPNAAPIAPVEKVSTPKMPANALKGSSSKRLDVLEARLAAAEKQLAAMRSRP